MPGIDGQWGENRKDPLGEHLFQPVAVGLVERIPSHEAHALLGQGRQDPLQERHPSPLEQNLDLGSDGPQLLGHRQAVGCGADTCRFLILEPSDSHLKELVECWC